MKNKNFWILALTILGLDFITKEISIKLLELEKIYQISTFLSFQRIYNSSTIMLNIDVESHNISSKYLIYFMFIVCSVLTYGIHWVMKREAIHERNSIAIWGKTGLFIILGAMWGNVVDRLFRPDGVVDFLRIDISENSAPIVNFADIMIYLGNFSILIAWILILTTAFNKRVFLKSIQ